MLQQISNVKRSRASSHDQHRDSQGDRSFEFGNDSERQDEQTEELERSSKTVKFQRATCCG